MSFFRNLFGIEKKKEIDYLEWESWGEISSDDKSHPIFYNRPVKLRGKLIMKWYDFIPYSITHKNSDGGSTHSSIMVEFLVNGRSIPARGTFDLNNVGEGVSVDKYFGF